MSRKKRVPLAMRQRLERQLSALMRYDEQQFATRLASAERMLPEEVSRPNFAIPIRQLWTDGAQDATVREWERALPKRWQNLVESLDGLAAGLTVDGPLNDESFGCLAELLVEVHLRNQLVADWKEDCHA